MKLYENQETPHGLAPRVVVSIIVFFSLLILRAMWASWGIKYGKEGKEKG
jgi:hypothetical protein